VREVAIAEKIANPSAPPTSCEAFRSAAGRPALSAGTPAFAAVVTATNACDRRGGQGRRKELGHRDYPGEYMGIPPTGKSVTCNEIFIFRFVNGRIGETWGCRRCPLSVATARRNSRLKDART
jgi:SnoaL-like polyketide cyclase